ncbi:ATP-binding protein [Mucilaginibacter sp. CAU 1740]|uniref:HAMP domain-containing sensor histidine kinase n=1 Tax=Mucilaginibacter sp. CAU 1740 TaxID=3140365 RepID=UPI00325AD5FA
MTIKNKLRTGIGFLFTLALICCGMSIYYLNRLSADAGAILKDNYKSVQYVQNILTAVDSRSGRFSEAQLKTINKNMALQQRNVTEVGEQQFTDSATVTLDKLVNFTGNEADLNQLRVRLHQHLYSIMRVNMDAISHKNDVASATSKRGTWLVAFFGALLFLVAFSFAVNFPGYIANPIKELTARIRDVSNKDYHQQIHFESDDEFGELGQAFNNMTRKLGEFENSNLASILFEKKRIETIINSMQDAIIGLDEKQVIIFANQVACNLIGMKAEQLTGEYAPDIALENDLMRKLLVNDQAKLRIFADNHEGFYSRESLSVNNKDKVIGKVIILKNVTEYQQLDEAKTNFIATISHELKTPISSIKMSLKLLEDERIGDVNAEQRQLISNIDDDTRRLLLITGELLDMAQVETGKLQLNFGSTHPQNIVDYAVKAIKFIADQKQVEIRVKCDETLPKVHADLDKTTWVLINLLSNAIKYSHEKSVVELTVKKHKNDEIEFSVTDHGKGIEEQYLPRLFERYFKVPNASSEQAGTGLGLAIAKDFIEAQAGKISVDSEIGSGSTFCFTLKRSITAA